MLREYYSEGKDIYNKEGDFGRIIEVPTKDDPKLRIEWLRIGLTSEFDTVIQPIPDVQACTPILV